MSTATWSTTPIPAFALAVGDRACLRGPVGGPGEDDPTTVTVARYAERLGVVTLLLDNGVTLEGESSWLVDVHVPDEPVDGYNLWRPKRTTWMSGCICVARRHPTLAGNWERVVTDNDCPSHGVHDDYED